MAMTKTDMQKIVEQHTPSGAAANRIITDLLAAMQSELRKGQGIVKLSGIGNITRITRKARKGRNPQTGEGIDVPERRALKISTSAELFPER